MGESRKGYCMLPFMQHVNLYVFCTPQIFENGYASMTSSEFNVSLLVAVKGNDSRNISKERLPNTHPAHTHSLHEYMLQQ